MTKKKSSRSPKEPAALSLETVEALIEQSALKAKKLVFPILITITVFCLGMAVIGYFVNAKNKKNAEAYGELDKALSINLKESGAEIDTTAANEKREKLESIVQRYSGSPAAQDAEYHLANLEFNLGNFLKAEELFRKYHEQYPDYQPLSSLAQLSEANCALATGKIAHAKSKYDTIAKDPEILASSSFVISQANLKLAICEMIVGDFDRAKEVLNEILASDSDELHTKEAQSLLSKIEILPAEELQKSIYPPTGEPSSLDQTTEETEPEASPGLTSPKSVDQEPNSSIKGENVQELSNDAEGKQPIPVSTDDDAQESNDDENNKELEDGGTQSK